VRFDRWLHITSYHDGYHAFPNQVLFDLVTDPHEQRDVAAQNRNIASRANQLLSDWHEQMRQTPTGQIDPMHSVLDEGGPFHGRGQLPAYLKRLRTTGREAWAALLEVSHPGEVT
jgi:hypothetical protein